MDIRRTGSLLSTALALALVGAACGDTKEETSQTGAGVSTASSASTAPAGKTLEVTGSDYAFEGVPATVAAGTTISFKNSSAKEVHELVALKVKDGETRPVADLLALPEAERDQAAEFKGVLFAFPKEAGMAPQGPVILTDKGRYIFVCTIPTGADPAAYRAAAQQPGPPPDVPGGPPHVAKGMVKEVKVG